MLYSRFLLILCFIYSNVYMTVQVSQFVPPPPYLLGNHKLVFYIWNSVSVFKISSFKFFENFMFLMNIALVINLKILWYVTLFTTTTLSLKILIPYLVDIIGTLGSTFLWRKVCVWFHSGHLISFLHYSRDVNKSHFLSHKCLVMSDSLRPHEL